MHVDFSSFDLSLEVKSTYQLVFLKTSYLSIIIIGYNFLSVVVDGDILLSICIINVRICSRHSSVKAVLDFIMYANNGGDTADSDFVDTTFSVPSRISSFSHNKLLP